MLRNDLLAVIGVFAAMVLAYQPVWHAGFIWNDSDYVTRPELQSISGLVRIWCDVGATEQYYPVLHSAFWLEHRLWGDNATGYHLINLLFHGVSAILLAMVLRRLDVKMAWLGAFLFCLHPVCVESVAWIAEQKNTLSTLFFLASGWCYLRFDETQRTRFYVSGFTLFFAAVLSKSVTASLPAALLLVFWWRRGRLSWRRDLLPLLPWFLVGALLGLFTAWVERAILRAEGPQFALTIIERCELAAHVVFFYLGKWVWPGGLIFIYPRWSVGNGGLNWYLPVLGLVALVGALWGLRRFARGPLAALLFFCGSLFPVLGFFNVYGFNFSFVADHWQYLAAIGIVAAACVAFEWISPARRLRTMVAVILVLGLGVLSWRQSGMYRDGERLYRTTLESNPACWMAAINLGSLLSEQGRYDEAARFCAAAVRLRPDYAPAYYQLGVCLARKGSLAEAAAIFEQAVHQRPEFAEAHSALGIADAMLGRFGPARWQLLESLRLKPGYPPSVRELARLPVAPEAAK